MAATAVTRGDASTLVDGYPKNYDYGWGELDAYAAVAEADGAVGYTPTPFPVELYQNPTIADGTVWDYEFEVTDPNTQISAVVTNGGVWTAIYLGEPWNDWFTVGMGQDFDAELRAPTGTPGGTLVDQSTCEVDSDTQCGSTGRQETLVADPADFPGGVLPLGTWRVHVEPWSDTDGLPEEIIDLTVTMGPVGGSVPPPPPPNAAPVASFTNSISDRQVTFTDTSTDGDGTVTGWSWDFGDGNGSSAQNPVYTYTADGTYTVTLTVTDDDGAASASLASQDVTVSAPTGGTLVADFTPSVDSATGVVTLTATPADGDSYDWVVDSWSGGWKNDPNPSLAPNGTGSNVATFTAKKSGDYVVTLTVVRAAASSSKTRTGAVSLSDSGGTSGGKPCNPNRKNCRATGAGFF